MSWEKINPEDKASTGVRNTSVSHTVALGDMFLHFFDSTTTTIVSSCFRKFFKNDKNTGNKKIAIKHRITSFKVCYELSF